MSGAGRPLAALSVVVALVACRTPARAVAETDAAASPASSKAASVGDAGPAVVDLLHSVACVVAVSSKVDNPKDFPEHLVDGKAETAWNGKTGDLHGWIAFRTPPVTRVKRVELTVGFDKGELFTKNHRITKVRLSRGGTIVREADLDPEIRGFQGIDVDEAGGDFKLEVLATLPGAEKTWRELTVSELRVLGHANGAPENPTHLPAMAIGNLDGVVPHVTKKGSPPTGPFPSIAALCAAYDKVMAPLMDAVWTDDRYPGKISAPHCAPWTDTSLAKVGATVKQGPFLDGQFVRVNDTSLESARLVLETEKGFSLTPVVLWSRHHDDPGCGHLAAESKLEDAKLVASSVARQSLVIRMLQSDVYNSLVGAGSTGTIETAYACAVDDTMAVTCQGPLVVGRSTAYPPGWDNATLQFPRVDPNKVAWGMRKEPLLGPAGDLRFGP